MALPAYKMVVVVAGNDQLEEVASIFQGHSLQDANGFEGFNGTVNGDQIRFGQFCPFANLGSGLGPIKGQENIEYSLTFSG